MSKALLQPGVPRSAYPERREPRDSWLDRLYLRGSGTVRRMGVNRGGQQRLVQQVAAHGQSLGGLKLDELAAEARQLRARLRSEGFDGDPVARSFALVREAADRLLDQRHYDVQLLGGWLLLNGMVAEMETGEGKTLTATLAACTAALAGVPVHVITVNDYLVKRDSEWMGPIYRALGLTVGVVVHGMDHREKQEAYRCDVTYCTNKQIAFDYLRDRIILEGNPSHLHLQLERLYGGPARASRLLLRGLYYAIVDEADSVLIDESRTPLIISASQDPEEERNAYETSLAFAGKLTPRSDFKVDLKDRSVELTDDGRGKLDELGRSRGGLWSRRRLREELVQQALTAKHLFFRDRHYLVKDGKVQIIDEYTGRILPDRTWEHGLHQTIEVKEGCPLSPRNRPVARISYQRFFRRYLRLAGMTGTAREVAGELRHVYGLAVVRVPTNRPVRRLGQPERVFLTVEEKWAAIAARIESLHRSGRPILVGTRSVEASEHLSRLLRKVGLPHQVLNARQDREEAEIIARAGERSRITVATNMAGRGTDIRLGAEVADLGGLHVIASERHEARRIDRQLFGRCGRQGDPGSYEAIVSLEDELITLYARRLKRLIAPKRPDPGVPLTRWLGAFLFRHAQRTAERRHWKVRRVLLRMDEYLERTLAFSGAPE